MARVFQRTFYRFCCYCKNKDFFPPCYTFSPIILHKEGYSLKYSDYIPQLCYTFYVYKLFYISIHAIITSQTEKYSYSSFQILKHLFFLFLVLFLFGISSERLNTYLYPKCSLRTCYMTDLVVHSIQNIKTSFSSCRPHSNKRQKYMYILYVSIQFSSVTQLCSTLCDPMNRSMPGLPVHHQLPELTQTHVHQVGDTIQPSLPLLSPSPPAPNPSQHQSLFQ